LGQKGSRLFLKAGLDRANQLESIAKNNISAHVNRERVGRVFAGFAARTGLTAEIARGLENCG
jgi:hypothetical protein